MIMKDELADHDEEFHKLVDCVNCHQMLEMNKLVEHQDTCLKRLQICKFCNQQFSYDLYFNHEESCGSRTQECMYIWNLKHPEILFLH